MEELVQRLSENTGLSQEKSQEVVNVVVAHLKERLPEALANRRDTLLAGGTVEGGSLAEKAKAMASGLGSMFGKKPE